MAKPRSIARFEQLYWASVVLGLLNAILNWQTSKIMLQANPLLAKSPWFLPLTQGLGLLIAVLLWFFIARRPSAVAKWVVVVFAAFGGLGIASAIFLLVIGRVGIGTQVILALLVNVLYIAAAVMLFKPDAKAWFGEGLDEDELDGDELDAPRL